MNEQLSILSELLKVLHEEELIRLVYRLRRVGKPLAALALDHELNLRHSAAIHQNAL